MERNTQCNLHRDIKTAKDLIRNCGDRAELANLVGLTERTLRRILTEKDYAITAKALYAILKYGPALQKETA